MMLAPLKKDKNQTSKFIRRRILSIGCPICCPAATYNKVVAGKSILIQTISIVVIIKHGVI